MHWSNIGLLVVAGLDFGVGLLVWKLNPKNKINIFFALQQASLGFWALGAGLFRETSNEVMAWVWVGMQNLGGPLAIIFLFLFSHYFPYQRRLFSLRYKLITSAGVLFVLSITLIPGIWVTRVVLDPPNSFWMVNKITHILFFVFFVTFISLAFRNFLSRYIGSQGFVRRQLSSVFVGISILTFISAIFGASLPVFTGEIRYLWVVPYFVLPLIIGSVRLIFSSRAA